MNNRHMTKTMPHQQSGAVLAVSLMILIVLTLIGVSSINGSILELIMSGNTQNRVRALNNAETTMLIAQKEVTGNGAMTITGGVLSCDAVLTGLYHDSNGSCPGVTTPTFINPTSLDWDGTDSITGIDANNRYMLESMGIQTSAECSGDVEDTDCTSKFAVYRITTRSEDIRGTVRMVQAIWNNAAN